MDRYKKIARIKISDLIKREDFKCFSYIGEFLVVLEFENSSCEITNFGKVLWEFKDKKEIDNGK